MVRVIRRDHSQPDCLSVSFGYTKDQIVLGEGKDRGKLASDREGSVTCHMGTQFCFRVYVSVFQHYNTHLQSKILQSESTLETNLALEKIKRPLYEKHPMSKFAWTIAEDTDTMEWYNICQDALRKVNESYQGKETADIIQNKVLQVGITKEKLFGICWLLSSRLSGWF
ncbi:uncharacterized protein E5676_scaffold874G00260 [Cucumis melo var. makuwa]|uniref:Uncharacterized protein n=1 Tax=Cucumis melo var. makuwa TaxID=1194695 RepID=A0A5D3CGR3_CUCMM|nr:uncharacterized protein E5676_scaffold874G00260 [Cucumis melo var. makuwa]